MCILGLEKYTIFAFLDVNECDLQPSKCLQGCYNTNGSFQCYCRPGFKLNDDKISCSGTVTLFLLFKIY